MDKEMAKRACGGKKMTNAQRIRTMNDEELAVFLADEIPHGDCYDCRLDCTFLDKGKFNDSCKNAWYEWLKEPVEIGNEK